MKNLLLIILIACSFAGCKKDDQPKLVTFEYTATKGSFDLNLFLIRDNQTIVLRDQTDTKATTFSESFEVRSGDKIHGRAKANYLDQVITGSILYESRILDKSSENFNNTGYFNITATIP